MNILIGIGAIGLSIWQFYITITGFKEFQAIKRKRTLQTMIQPIGYIFSFFFAVVAFLVGVLFLIGVFSL
ncbi:MAG: hypothetical protein LBV67_00300 [Streptococcaceae bacterium]|nr:hypothetical protein [Streptococcaceae bacterium]